MPCSSPLPTTITFRKKAVFLLETLTVYFTSSPFFAHELGFDTNIHPVIQGNVSPIPFWELTMISLSQYDGFSLPVWSGLACEPPGQWDIVGIKQWSGEMCPCSWRAHHKWWLLSDLRLCLVWPGSLKMFCLLEATKVSPLTHRPALTLSEWVDGNMGPDSMLSCWMEQLSLSLPLWYKQHFVSLWTELISVIFFQFLETEALKPLQHLHLM